MKTVLKVFLVFVSCASVLTESSNETSPSDIGGQLFFFLNPDGLYYTSSVSDLDPIGIETKQRICLSDLVYDAKNSKIFWIKPRVELWKNNARIMRMGWNPEKLDCNPPEQKIETTTIKLDIDENVDEDDDGNEVVIQNEHDMQCKQVKGDDGRTQRWYSHIAEIHNLRQEEDWNPRSLALDWINGYLYLVDASKRTVDVLKQRTKYRSVEVFYREELMPLEIALDPERGLMFVLAAHLQLEVAQIYRMNMDGSDVLLIIEEAYKLGSFKPYDRIGFTINESKKRVYFANFPNEIIESVNYNGTQRVTVAQAKYPISLSILNNTLYYPGVGDVESNKSTTLMCINYSKNIYSCKLNESGACNSVETFVPGSAFDYGVYAFKAFALKQEKKGEYPCNNKKKKCEHYCLLKSSVDSKLQHSCACSTGFELATDFKQCRKVEATHDYDSFYLPKNITYPDLLKSSFPNNIYPISVKLMEQLTYSSAGIAFGQHPFSFFTTDDYRLMSKNLEPQIEPLTPLTDLDKSLEEKLEFKKVDTDSENIDDSTLSLYEYRLFVNPTKAYNWITGNLYYVEHSVEKELAELSVLYKKLPNRVTCFNMGCGRTRLIKSGASIAQITPPRYLVVHPYRGYVFAALTNGSTERLNADGSNEILLHNINNSVLLALDFIQDKLYWMDNEGYVNYANLDGRDSKSLLRIDANSTKFMYVYGDWFYVRENDKLIKRFNKTSGEQAGSLDIKKENFYHDIIKKKVPLEDARLFNKEDHSCHYGKCHKFCYEVPNGEDKSLNNVCGCSKKQILQFDILCNKEKREPSKDQKIEKFIPSDNKKCLFEKKV